MTDPQVDHADAAANCLVRADLQGGGEVAADLRFEGLVHATLALVEQQRIANVLAIDAMHFDSEGNQVEREWTPEMEWASTALGVESELDEALANHMAARKAMGL